MRKKKLLDSPKTWAKNLIKTGSLRRFLEFSISRQKRKNEKTKQNNNTSYGISVLFLVFPAETEKGRDAHKCKITRALARPCWII